MPDTGNTHPGGGSGALATPGRPWLGRLRFVALVVAVSLLHLWLADRADLHRFGLGPATDVLPIRMQVAFVRELAQQAPPAVAPGPGVSPRPPVQPRAAAPSSAASQPAGAERGPERGPESQADPAAVSLAERDASAALAVAAASAAQLAQVDEPALAPALLAAAINAAASTPAQAAASAASALSPATVLQGAATTTAAVGAAASVGPASAVQRVAWPPSTRLSYTLTGHYRGPVEGQAQVEWLLDGARYQVHMDLAIGPAFAPLASRRVSSEGLVTAQGLAPRRYDEVTRAMLRQPQAMTVWLDEDRVRLSNGRTEPRPPGVQDSASQFVQLTWLFTTQPSLLRAGQSVTLPLALPRNLEPWVYDVLGAQTLATPAGDVETFHVKPRRPPRAGSDLTAEIWVAPSLQYLPVRIVIRQDAETFLDLLISRLPQQAAVSR